MTRHTKKSSLPGLTPWRSLFTALFCLLATAGFAQTNPVHITVVSFSAPAGNQSLQGAAAALPDLLTASLSQDQRFVLVERDKINTVWSELHLTQAGFDSADTVVKLGKMLSCDWLLSGSLMPAADGPQIWVKVIDTQSSEVLDLQQVPYQTNDFRVTATNIAAFLTRAQSRSGRHEFVAWDTFQNLSISATREDWTARLKTMIESNLLAAGYGMVERDTVAPIFTEYQLQSGGITADASKRVKLKPAFWILGGSWKWIYDTQDKLSVMLTIQPMGGARQPLDFVKPPGPELDQAIVDGIEAALKSSGSITAEQALAAEQKLRQNRENQLMQGRGLIVPSASPNVPPTSITITDASGGTRTVPVDPGFLAQREARQQAMLKALQQAILLNPKDWQSKLRLGMALFGSLDPVENKQGSDLLEEVAASDDPVAAPRARNWLDDVRSGKIEFVRDPMGIHIVQHGQPASIPPPRN